MKNVITILIIIGFSCFQTAASKDNNSNNALSVVVQQNSDFELGAYYPGFQANDLDKTIYFEITGEPNKAFNWIVNFDALDIASLTYTVEGKTSAAAEYSSLSGNEGEASLDDNGLYYIKVNINNINMNIGILYGEYIYNVGLNVNYVVE